MKTLIVAILLVSSLYSQCEDSFNRWNKFVSLHKMASERNDFSRMKFTNERKIYYSELVISECQAGHAVEEIKKLRLQYIEAGKLYDGL